MLLLLLYPNIIIIIAWFKFLVKSWHRLLQICCKCSCHITTDVSVLNFNKKYYIIIILFFKLGVQINKMLLKCHHKNLVSRIIILTHLWKNHNHINKYIFFLSTHLVKLHLLLYHTAPVMFHKTLFIHISDNGTAYYFIFSAVIITPKTP